MNLGAYGLGELQLGGEQSTAAGLLVRTMPSSITVLTAQTHAAFPVAHTLAAVPVVSTSVVFLEPHSLVTFPEAWVRVVILSQR